MDKAIYNNIKSALEEAYHPTSEVKIGMGPSYLLKDGKFIYLDNVHVEEEPLPRGSIHGDEKTYLILTCGFKKEDVQEFWDDYFYGAMDNNDGGYREQETIVRLNANIAPTDAQYSSLKEWLEAIIYNPGGREYIYVAIHEPYGNLIRAFTKDFAKYPLQSYNSQYDDVDVLEADYIIGRIRQYYASGNLYEAKEPKTEYETIKQALVDSGYFPIGKIDETGFILPDGDFLNTADNSYSSPWHNSVEGYLQEVHLENEEAEEISAKNDSGDGSPTLEALGAIRVSSGECYICLPPVRPTEAAFDALNRWLDYYIQAYSWSDNGAPAIYVTNYEGNVDNSYYPTDDIVKKIKRYYGSHKLVETNLEEKKFSEERFDWFATNNPYEAKNILLNSKEAMRVFIDETGDSPLYLIGNAHECVHIDLIELAQMYGYSTSFNEYDKSKLCLIYAPKTDDLFDEHGDAVMDGYDDAYYYNGFAIYTREANFQNFDLYKILGNPKSIKPISWRSHADSYDDEYWEESLNEDNQSANKLLNWLETKIGASTNPNMEGASYILPDGKFLQINDGPWKDDYPDEDKYDTHGDFHYYVADHFPELKTDKYIIEEYLNVIRINNYEDYIMLSSKHRPNDRQLISLRAWIDKYIAWCHSPRRDLIYDPNSLQISFGFEGEPNIQQTEINTNTQTSKDAINIINNFYRTGSILEDMNIEDQPTSLTPEQTQELIDYLKKTFGSVTTEYIGEACYLTPDGEYINLGEEHDNGVNEIYYWLDKNQINLFASDCEHYMGTIHCGNSYYSYLWIAKKPTQAQIKALSSFEEYNLGRTRDLEINFVSNDKPIIVTLYFDEERFCYVDKNGIKTSLAKEINKYFSHNPIKEEVEIVKDKNKEILFTDSPYVVKNKLLASKDVLRIYIDASREKYRNIDVYLVGKADQYTHMGMLDVAYYNGIQVDFNDDDPKQICIIYVPKERELSFTIEDAVWDSYDTMYQYKDFIIFSRLSNFEKFKLYEILGEPIDIKDISKDISYFEEDLINEVTYSKESPHKTGTAYKVFRVKNGKLYPPMVANTGGKDTPVGVWLDAEEGEFAGLSKTGRKQVKSTGSGNLAYRPGWHLGDIPRAKQFDRLNKETGEYEFPKDFVWAECDYAMDVDYQPEADEQGYMRTKIDDKGEVQTYRSDKYQHSLAGLKKLPKGGYYKYRTNPNPDTVPWVITGQMKVNRLLSDDEVNQILKSKGIDPIHRQGGDKTLKELGLTESLTEAKEEVYYIDRAGKKIDCGSDHHNIDLKFGDIGDDGISATVKRKGWIRVRANSFVNSITLPNSITDSQFDKVIEAIDSMGTRGRVELNTYDGKWIQEFDLARSTPEEIMFEYELR